jgi:membrane carboxypeptidase/penicillin-binding protein
MKRVLKDYPPRDFPVPEDIVFLKMDTDTGYLALPGCPHQALQAFRKGQEPAEYCPHDHSKPLELKASFGPARDLGGLGADATGQAEIAAPAQAPEPGEEPAPSDEQSESLY